jgi:excisionase family DNA binding protein
MPGKNNSNIVTAKEVGRYLKLTDSTIYKLALTGEIPGFKVGKSWRFEMNDIVRMVDRLKNGQPCD